MGKPTCSIAGCAGRVVGWGWCMSHYYRWQTYGDPMAGRPVFRRLPTTVRFWQKVDRSGGDNACWLWTAYLKENGYGQFFPVRGHPAYAHRYAFELLRGPIPNGLELDHLCRNRACVNPTHLEPVTHLENLLRGMAPVFIAHRSDRCARGHLYTPENTMIEKGRYRRCRTCRRADERTRNAVRKGD